METFNWSPKIGPKSSTTFRRLTAQFGDGYRQAAADGINNKVESWPLQFVGAAAYVTPIRAFLDRHAGVRSFRWTPPMGIEGWYEASAYGVTAIGGGAYSLDATFQQVFRP